MKKAQIIRMLIAGTMFWLIGFCGYKMGQSDDKETRLQIVTDTSKARSDTAEKIWREIQQNNAQQNRKLDEAINTITNFKPIIKYEIHQNTQKIAAFSGSTLQIYIDSIRANGGFH